MFIRVMLDSAKLFDTEEIKDLSQTEIVLDFLRHSIKDPNCEFKVMKKHISEEEVAAIPIIKHANLDDGEVYYEDERLRVVENASGMYNIYDAKFGNSLIHRNVSKKWTDDFIQRTLKRRKNKTTHVKPVE